MCEPRLMVPTLLVFFQLLAIRTTSGCVSPTANTTISNNVTINASCVSVVYSNVTFNSGLPLRISLSEWHTASTGGAGGGDLVLSVMNSSLVNGSTIVVDAGDVAASSSIPQPNSVTITVSQLIGTLGGIMFKGTFPRNTSIVVSNAVMRIATGPSFSFLFDSMNPQMGIGIGFLNVTLQGASSVLLQRISFNGTVGYIQSAYPIYFGGPRGLFTVANGSYFTMSELTMDAPALNLSLVSSSLFVFAGDMLISNGSQFLLTSSAVEVYGDVMTFNGTTSVTNNSVFAITNSNFSSLGGLGMYFYNDITVSVSSQWYLTGAVIDTENDALDHWGTETVNSGSALFFDSCVLKSRSTWETGSACAVDYIADIIVDGPTSQWFMRDVMIYADHIRGAMWNCGLAVSGGIYLQAGATMFWDRCNISSYDSSGIYLTFSISGSSRAFLSNCLLRASWAVLELSPTLSGGSLLAIVNTLLVRVDPPTGDSILPGICTFVGDLNVSNHSLFHFSGNTLTTLEANESTTTHVTGMTLDRVIVSGFSSIKMQNCSFYSPFSTGINFTGSVDVRDYSTFQLLKFSVAAPKGSVFQAMLQFHIVNNSAMTMQNWNVSGSQAMRLYGVTVTNSWMLLQNMSIFVSLSFPCIVFAAVFLLDGNTTSYASLLDLNCLSSASAPIQGLPSAVGVGTFFVRCFQFNGVAAPTSLWPAGYTPLVCGMCTALSDCFVPLTARPLPSTIACGSVCSCVTTLPILTEDPLCLPATGAVGLPEVSTAAPHSLEPSTLIPATSRPSTAAPSSAPMRNHTSTAALSVTRDTASLTLTAPRSESPVLSSSPSASKSDQPTAGTKSLLISSDETISRTQSSSPTWTLPVPIPPARLPPVGGVFASAVALSAATTFPATAFAVQRTMLLGALSLCSFSLDTALDVATSPTSLLVGGEPNGFLRGAVVGNWLLWAGCVLLAVIVAKVIAITSKKSLIASWDELSLPGNFVTPFSFLSQPTVMCSLAMVAHSTSAGDVVFGVISLTGIGIVCGVATLFITVKFGSRTVLRKPSRRRPRLACLFAASRFLFESREEWVDRVPHFTARLGKIFESCRGGGVQWFAAYEAWYAVTGGLIGGLMPSDGSTCNHLLIATTVLAALYVLMLVIFRPYASKVDASVSLANGLLNLAASVEALMSADDSIVAATNSASQYVSLASVSLMMLQTVLMFAIEARPPLWLQRISRLCKKSDAPSPPCEIEVEQAEAFGTSELLPAPLAPTELREVLKTLKVLLERVAAMMHETEITEAERHFRLEQLIQLISSSKNGSRHCQQAPYHRHHDVLEDVKGVQQF